MKKLVILLGVALLLASCGKKVTNEGTITLENGRKEQVEIPFTCVGCVENLATIEEFDSIVYKVSDLVKGRLNNPLSYIPTKLELTIKPQDSIISFYTNEPFPNLLLVSYTMDYIAQNAYGTEKEGEIEDGLLLSNGKEVDILDDVKQPAVTLEERDGTYIPNRRLTVYSLEDEDAYIRLFPVYGAGQFVIGVSCSISCLDRGDRLYINFKEEEKPVVLENRGGFNCDGKAAFNPSQEDKEKLANNQIALISIHHDSDKVACSVPANQADYLQQVLALDPAKTQQ